MTASTLTLSDFETRLRAYLVDAGSASYADAALEEALRQATGDLGEVYGFFVTIKDLDSAAATNLDQRDESLTVRGAAGYAARMRAVDRADSANLGQSMPGNLLDWSKNTLYYFDQAMRRVKIRIMQESANEQQGLWDWDESEKNW